MDCSPPGSSMHGMCQARILEWVAISFSRGSSWSRDRTWVPCISCIGRQILYCWATGEVLPIGYTALLETLANLFILIFYLNSANPRPQESNTFFWPLYVHMPLYICHFMTSYVHMPLYICVHCSLCLQWPSCLPCLAKPQSSFKLRSTIMTSVKPSLEHTPLCLNLDRWLNSIFFCFITSSSILNSTSSILFYNQLFWSIYPKLDHKFIENKKVFICFPSIVPGAE